MVDESQVTLAKRVAQILCSTEEDAQGKIDSIINTSSSKDAAAMQLMVDKVLKRRV